MGGVRWWREGGQFEGGGHWRGVAGCQAAVCGQCWQPAQQLRTEVDVGQSTPIRLGLSEQGSGLRWPPGVPFHPN